MQASGVVRRTRGTGSVTSASVAAGGRVKARPSLNGFNLPCSRCCIFFSCNFELLGERAPLDWLGVVDPAGAGFDLASAADASFEPALEAFGAAGTACGTNVTGTLRRAIRFTVCRSPLFLLP